MDKNDRSQDGPPDSAPAMRSADVLLWGALPHLQLNIAQTADLCGISVRQLGYWTKQGYVTASGRGARRMYGLDSLRHVLAIKNAMANGASLRQALKVLPPGTTLTTAASDPPEFLTPQQSLRPAPLEVRPAPPPRSPQEREALAADLIGLFDANRHTRDDASGLAVKIGRPIPDIRDTAEALCSRGVLSKTISQGSVVFQRAQQERV